MKFLAILLVLPAVFSAPAEENAERSLFDSSSAALGANFAQQNAASETHDKKNFGLDFSSDRGSSNKVSSTGLQTAVTGAVAQQPQGYYPQYPPQYPPQYYPYQYYPYQYPQYYQYPAYPNYGVPNVGVPNIGIPSGGSNVGVPNLASGSSVQLPNLSASSGAAVTPGPGPIRY